MKLKTIHRGKARKAQDETCGQTPQEEVQLKGLGWNDSDIDHMTAKQVELIIRKKTRKRAKASAERTAANTPEQVVSMLDKKMKGAQALYDQLKEMDYTTYNIGDFFKRDLPKLRSLSDRIDRVKKDLEVALYSYLQQARKDHKEFSSKKGASFTPVEGAKGVQGAHHQVGKDWYVDTEFINHSQQVYPGATLRHMGMGEFVLETPDGDIEFDRMRGKDFPGQSGRSHKLYGDPKAVAKLLKLMEQKGKSKKAEVQAAEGGWQTVKINGKPYRWRKNDLFKKNPHTQAALDIQYENPKVGWRDVVNLGTRDQVFKAVIKKASVKAATKFSPFGTPGGTWWGKRAEDSKIMRLKEPVAKQWAAKPSMKDNPPKGPNEYLGIYWVPPEYGRESRWRVEKNWITPVWDWGLGPNKKVKPGVDVVKQQS